MSSRKKELANTMKQQAEIQAAEGRGQQLAMEKAGEKAEEIAQEVADGTKRVYKAIEKGDVLPLVQFHRNTILRVYDTAQAVQKRRANKKPPGRAAELKFGT